MEQHHLTEKEQLILNCLERGMSYTQILARIKMSPSAFYVHCQHIREKTGIEDTRNSDQCRAYVRRTRSNGVLRPKIERTKVVSPRQMQMLNLIAKGLSYAEIAKTCSIDAQTAQNNAWRACRNAGINGAGSKRTAAIREYLESLNRPASPMEDPSFQ